jgi:ribosomal protein S18 acetylase RimI-like enzyme
MTVTVRRARQEDISGVIGVMRQVTSEKRYVVAESVEQQLSGDSTLMDTDLENQHFFVATVDDEVIGWCGLDIPEMDKLSHTAELTLGVLEEYRGKGIGDHLLERGLKWAEEKGLHKVYNSIPSVNESAIEFLEGHGWETEAVRSDHYRIDGEFVDEVMMERTFK